MACDALRLIEVFAPFLMRWQFNEFFVLLVTFHKLLQVTDLVKALCIVYISPLTNQIFQAGSTLFQLGISFKVIHLKQLTLPLVSSICTDTPSISYRGLQLRKENCSIHLHIPLLFFQLEVF